MRSSAAAAAGPCCWRHDAGLHGCCGTWLGTCAADDLPGCTMSRSSVGVGGGRLEGKVALITGAARGQGFAEAELFAAEGARVFMTDVIAPERSLPLNCTFITHDVTSEADWERVVREVVREAGGLHVLVNNAGVFRQGNMDEETVEGWDFVFSVNVKGVWLGMKHAARAMKGTTLAKDRAIVNISSVAGLIGAKSSIAYGASKWAVRGMTKSAATDLAEHGIRCNSVHPGLISTQMLHATDGTGVGIPEAASPASVPLGRLAQAEEVAKLVLFLASDDASYVSGGEFTIDGAMTAGLPSAARTAMPAPVAQEEQISPAMARL